MGENGRISLSRFGTDWKDESFPCGCRLNDIAANESQIVIVGEDGRILSSPIGDILPASIGGSRGSGPRFQFRRAGGSGLSVDFQVDQDSDIRLTAYDISGRKLAGYTGRVGKGKHSRDILLGAAHTGLCFLELVTAHGRLVGKALLQ